MSDHPPIEQIYDLADISAGGAEVTVTASPPHLPKLADWLGVESVEKFRAVVNLKKLATNRYRYDADLTCDLTQSSVVSLEPVRTHIAESFSRELHVIHHNHAAPKSEEVTLAAAEDEAPEEIPSSRYDLAGPLLEELALALDPYPRSPDEVFSPPEADEAPPESPFAVLKKLRGDG
ncbi:MAG TPA: YceD family protein [Rhizomicrobium sp.]|nr:YceD family protein [Rhizomicrobium sp.]